MSGEYESWHHWNACHQGARKDKSMKIESAALTAMCQKLERLEKAATPGPWHFWSAQVRAGEKMLMHTELPHEEGECQACADIEAVIALRNAVPALIDAAREVVRLREALDQIAACPEGHSKTWPEIDEIVRAARGAK